MVRGAMAFCATEAGAHRLPPIPSLPPPRPLADTRPPQVRPRTERCWQAPAVSCPAISRKPVLLFRTDMIVSYTKVQTSFCLLIPGILLRAVTSIMSAAGPPDPKSPGLPNGQGIIHNAGRTPCPADAAAQRLADSTGGQSHRDVAPMQDPFTYYKAFLASDTPSSSHTASSGLRKQGSTGDTFGQSGEGSGEPQECRPRPAPYNLAVRFASRSNGAPLATIIEQGSVSTLNSRGSLLSVGRFPSIRAVETQCPVGPSHRASKRLDEKALRYIQEETPCGHDTGLKAFTKTKLGLHDTTRREHHGATLAQRCTTASQAIEQAHLPADAQAIDSKGLRGFLRGVLHNPRRGSRSRSRSSVTHPSEAQSEDRDTDLGQGSASENNGPVNTDTGRAVCSATRGSDDTYSESLVWSYVPRCLSAGTDSQRRTCVQTSMPCIPPPSRGIDNDGKITSQLLPLPDVSRPRNGKEKFSSVCRVSLEPHDSSQNQVRAVRSTLSQRNQDEGSTQYTFDGVSAYRNDAASLRESDHIRTASRNASFCSTTSTSYSGTVLGVDLDLQHDFSRSGLRSVTPVWFAPMYRAIDAQELSYPGGIQELQKQLPSQSMDSSTLSSRPPIAAAEGIVKPNLNTPQISFFSPSGNLVHASISPLPSASSSRSNLDVNYLGAPITSTSYYSNDTGASVAHSALSEAADLSCARPAAVSTNIEPQSTVPLPEHLRYYRNCLRAEKPDKSPAPDSGPLSPPTITPVSAVKGCGGIIRSKSLLPHSGIPPPPDHSPQQCRSGKLVSNLLSKRELSSPRPGLASTQSFRKGNTLKKRAHQRPSSDSSSSLGPMAGNALRICFCQPYDGAGDARHAPPGRDTETPNARIVDGGAGGPQDRGCDKGNRRARRDSAVSVGTPHSAAGG